MAAVDLGTNSALLTVVEESNSDHGEPRVLQERCEIPRLGEGLDERGTLSPQAIERTLAVLREYAQVALRYDAPLRAVVTQALREARGAQEFVRAASAALGVPLEVIDGEREAALAFRAAIESFSRARESAVVVDVGGGSTEIICGRQGAVETLVSIPIGSVRVTERHLHHDPPTAAELAAARAAAGAAFASVPSQPADVFVGIAGTVTTLASITLELATYDAERVHGSTLSIDAVERWLPRLCVPLDERRRIVGLDPRRADVIIGGAIVLLAVAAHFAVKEVLVSDRGVRWGLIYEMLRAR